jgi:hypothetical protein
MFSEELSKAKRREILERFERSLNSSEYKFAIIKEQSLSIRKKLEKKPENREIISLLDIVLELLEVTANNLEKIMDIRELFSEYMELADLEIEYLSDKMAGLDKKV